MDEGDPAKRMMTLLYDLAPHAGLVNADALDRRAEILAAAMPGSVVHRYASGHDAGSWIMPERWEGSGDLRDAEGRVLASSEECFLFVAPYSQPVDGTFSKAEMAPHVRTAPHRPRAYSLEHRYAYNARLKDWGITLPHERWEAMPEDGRFHVRIRTERRAASLGVVERFVRGRTDQVLNISAHYDELCNDDLSGCVVASELVRAIARRGTTRYSYQVTLAPELIGTVAYVHANPDVVARTFGTLNLETLGAGEDLYLKRSLDPQAYLNKVLRLALKAVGAKHREMDFFDGYGNDERTYSWPTIDVPGVALQRYPFKEYHTSEDTPSIVKPELLEEGLRIAEAFVDILERDTIPRFVSPIPPWLSRYGLYYDAWKDRERFNAFNNHAIHAVRGDATVAEIADRLGLGFDELDRYFAGFVEHGFMQRAPVAFDERRRPVPGAVGSSPAGGGAR